MKRISWARFIKNKHGMGTVEVVVIVAVLVGVALIFRNAIVDFVKSVVGMVFKDEIKEKVDPENMLRFFR